MNRRQATQVASILLIAVGIRVLLFKHVGVWGDFGFWAYDARLINEGQTPFIDFMGRSPVYVYLLAAVREYVGHPLVSLRATSIFFWLLTAPLVYYFAKRIHSHSAGLVALGLYLLTPFPVVYGMWVNSQGFTALMTMAALWAVLENPYESGYPLAGIFLGIGFLARRSAIVILGAVMIFGVIQAWNQVRRPESLRRDDIDWGFVSPLLTPVSFLATLLVCYYFIGKSVSLSLALFETHFVNLLISTGRGGFPIIGVDVPPYQNEIEHGRVPIFNSLCQLCGAWTARVGLKTVLLTTSIVGPMWIYMRDITDRWFTLRDLQYMYGVLGLLMVYAMYLAAKAGFWIRIFGLLSLFGFAIVAYHIDDVDRDTLYSPASILLLLSLTALAGGYLYRNRLLHTYYFMDFIPMLSAVSGVILVVLWRRSDRSIRIVLAIALASALITSGLAAYPATDIIIEGNTAGWFTIPLMHQYSADLDRRTAPGDSIFTAHPSYVIVSNAELFNNRARIYQLTLRYRGTAVSDTAYRNLRREFRAGEISYVVLSGLTREILSWNKAAARAFSDNYCHVNGKDRLYEITNADLYTYNPDCPTGRQAPMITET